MYMEQTPQNPTGEPAQPVKRSRIWLIVFVIAGLTISGYLIFANMQNQWPFRVSVPDLSFQTSATPAVIPSLITSPIPTPTPDPTADWKIYKNEKYGFLLKYPIQFTTDYVESENPGSINSELRLYDEKEPDKTKLELRITKGIFDPQNLFDLLTTSTQVAIGKGDFKAIVYDASDPVSNKLYIQQNGLLFTFSGMDSQTPLIQQIIASTEFFPSNVQCETRFLRIGFSQGTDLQPGSRIYRKENGNWKYVFEKEWNQNAADPLCVDEYAFDIGIPDDILAGFSHGWWSKLTTPDAASWNTSADSSIGLRFKYPSDWSPFRADENAGILYSQKASGWNGPLTIHAGMFERNADWPITNVERVQFGNISGVMIASGQDGTIMNGQVISRSGAYLFLVFEDRGLSYSGRTIKELTSFEYSYSYDPRTGEQGEIEKAASAEFAAILKSVEFPGKQRKLLNLSFSESTGKIFFVETSASDPLALYSFDTNSGKLAKMQVSPFYAGLGEKVMSPNGKKIASTIEPNPMYEQGKKLFVLDLERDDVSIPVTLSGSETLNRCVNTCAEANSDDIKWLNDHKIQYAVFDKAQTSTDRSGNKVFMQKELRQVTLH
jgi:hypothetical protein